jgi:hypothetical protein
MRAQAEGKGATTRTLGASQNPSSIGKSLAFTATVSSLSATPTGRTAYYLLTTNTYGSIWFENPRNPLRHELYGVVSSKEGAVVLQIISTRSAACSGKRSARAQYGTATNSGRSSM